MIQRLPEVVHALYSPNLQLYSGHFCFFLFARQRGLFYAAPNVLAPRDMPEAIRSPSLLHFLVIFLFQLSLLFDFMIQRK